MNIDIDPAWIEIDEQERDGALSLHQSSMVPLAQGRVEHGVFDSAAIYENELPIKPRR
jgi:hypothetical protein